MPRYGVETKKSLEEAIEAAVAYFGPDGLGLEMEERARCCAYFEGGGGFVRVTASEEGKRTSLDLETREWDVNVREFVQRIGG